MKLPRRRFLRLAVGAAALPALPCIARAQTYPARTVRIFVGFGPGSAADIIARLMGQWLSERLGQPIVIENRLGASANVATEAVVNSQPDGYTLLMVSTPHAINATVYEKLNFNFIRDIAPVASIYRDAPGVMEVNPSFPAKTVPEFIAYAKANPGKINMASAGVGSGNHIYGELFKMMAEVDMLHVPYRGTVPALTDLISGQIQVMFDSLVSSVELIKTGKLRSLGVTTEKRSPVLPEIPTIAEFVPGYEASGWQGVGAPRNTPADVIDKLNKEINEGLADPKIKARLADLGYAASASSPAEFGKFVADETEKWGKVVKFAGIKAE